MKIDQVDDKLDTFVEQEPIPQYMRGARRAANPDYRQVVPCSGGHGDVATAPRPAARRGRCARTLPSTHPMDPGYSRLRYVRYADLCRGARHKSAYADARVMPRAV
jgi:hypothetical protein